MTRAGRAAREYDGREASTYDELFASLFVSAADIKNLELSAMYDDLPIHERPTQNFILSTLYKSGAIAYHKRLGMWLPFEANGHPNIYGVYPKYRLFGANATQFVANSEDVAIINANINGTPLSCFVRRRCELLEDFDRAIQQNLDAVKKMTVIVADNPAIAMKLRRLNAARMRGASIGIIDRTAEEFGELNTLETNAPYMVKDLLDDKRKVFEDTLHLVGVRTPYEKGERLITDEVNAANAETFAYIGIMDRTANKCCEQEELPFKFEFGRQVEYLLGELSGGGVSGVYGANNEPTGGDSNE